MLKRGWKKGLSLSSEQPRERLFLYGARELSLEELLTLLIGSGIRQKKAKEIAQEIIQNVFSNHFFHFSRLTPGNFLSIPGLGMARTGRILAGIELGRRLVLGFSKPFQSFLSSKDVFRWIQPRIYGLSYEVFYSLALDNKNRLLVMDEISRGNSESVSFSPRDTFCEMVRAKASAMIVVHNHPSGDPSPSVSDHELTKRLQEGANLLGIRFLDHLIVGDHLYYSFAESNSWPKISTSPPRSPQ